MNSVCIIQADNRDPESFYLKKTMIVNKRAAEKLNFDYEFIKFKNENNIHPATLKIKIINNLLKNTKYEIIIFIDSDAWIHDAINLNKLVNYFINSDKHAC
jgi:cellulose synthase/poly-beta-1,6-N-acetylglucosamine synthase-like glycosyltransferase